MRLAVPRAPVEGSAMIAVTLSLTLTIDVSLVRSQGWNSTNGLSLTKSYTLAAVDEARDDAAAMHVLQAIGNGAGLGEIDDAIREHLSVDAEVAPVRQASQHRVGNGSDPRLERGPVVHELGVVCGW
jgi:hypothetical protein